jgi:hypothetical protein
MQKKTLKYVLTVFGIICILMILAGIIGVALGHGFFYVSLIFGLGAIVPIIIELVPLYKNKPDVDNGDKNKTEQ